MKFKNGNEMLEHILNEGDLYNPTTGEYVFQYNEAGSICIYLLQNKQALDLAAKAKENDEYWGAYLSLGGKIYDTPENLEWCEDHCVLDGWTDTVNYTKDEVQENEDKNSPTIDKDLMQILDMDYLKDRITTYVKDVMNYNNQKEDLMCLDLQIIGLCDTFKLISSKQVLELRKTVADLVESCKKENLHNKNK